MKRQPKQKTKWIKEIAPHNSDHEKYVPTQLIGLDDSDTEKEC